MSQRGMGAAHVGQALGLVPRQVRLAARMGLLDRRDDGTFDPECVARAAADRRRFIETLSREQPLNASQAAARLRISRARFARVAAAAALPVVERAWVHRYGRELEVRYFRAADVDALLPHVVADVELRAAARTVARSEAAAKAARTRAANREKQRLARGRFAATCPSSYATPVEIVVWGTGLCLARGDVPAYLAAFADDCDVVALAQTVAECRWSDTELATHARTAATHARRCLRDLERPGRVRARLGVAAERLGPYTECVAGYLAAETLDRLVTSPPPWLLELRADEEFLEAEIRFVRWLERELEAQERRADAVVRAASALVSGVDDAGVADLLGLSVDVVLALRPRGGRWAPGMVAGLLRDRPAWAADEASAWAEVERRHHARALRERAREVRREGWRRVWAQTLGVDESVVPESVGRPTRQALQDALRCRPGWAC